VTLKARRRLALGLSVVAAACALGGALGPAEHIATTYSWPGSSVPERTPTTTWYTPLLLMRHQPEALTASLPCSPPQQLADAGRPLNVISSARHPELAKALSVTSIGRALVVSIGATEIARVKLVPEDSAGDMCSYDLALADDAWSIRGGRARVELSGALEEMPIVTGLFSGVDLRADSSVSAEVTTAIHTARVTTRQTIAWIVAMLAAAASLLLVAFESRPRPPWTVAASALRRTLGSLQAADGVVGIVLVAWWVVSPAFWDDGWVLARQRNFATTGGFSNYYDTLGTNLPNGYWLEWTQHWLTQSTSTLLVLRLPALLCLAAMWVLCRWMLTRLPAALRDQAALWALTAVFLAGALAWGMTLRPEPVTALLATGVLASTIRFLERGSSAPLVLVAVLLPLALTAHHSGIVALAPLIVAAPMLLRWSRATPAVAAAVAVTGLASLITLAFVGSDVSRRLADARATSEFGTYRGGWREELQRYVDLSVFPYGTPLRRAFVAIALLAVLAFVFRRRRAALGLLDFPAPTLGVALALFVVAPSKWPWHFGALVGLAALAAGAESARLGCEAVEARRWQLRPLIIVGAGMVTAAWAWSPRESWNALDLRTLVWYLGFEGSGLSMTRMAVLLPLVLLAGLIAVARLRGSSSSLPRTPWRAASWTAPVIAAPLLAFTVSVLATDAERTKSWTLTRQNLASLEQSAGCGLADDLTVPLVGSARPLDPVDGRTGEGVPEWAPPPPLDGLPVFTSDARGSGVTPWFELPMNRELGVFVSGNPDSWSLEWGQVRGNRVMRLGTDVVSMPAREAGSNPTWHFVSFNELPVRRPGANAVRLVFRSDVAPGPAFASSAVSYSHTHLARQLGRHGAKTYISPNLVTYFPCSELPRLEDGVARVPDLLVVWHAADTPVDFESSPFAGALDLYQLKRLPPVDSSGSRFTEFAVFEVDRRIPGASIAPPDRDTSIS
jgi:hypothetical protein